jgi:hypothetical protein
METNPVSEMCSLEYQMMDRVKKTVIMSVRHYHQNPLESTDPT